MKQILRFGTIAVFLLLFSACATIRVSTDYNPDYDFSQLKTYSWLVNGPVPGSDVRINNDIVVARVRASVEKSLAAKGFVLVEGVSADFKVSWLGAINKKLQIDTIDHFYSPYGYGALARNPHWGGGMRTTTAREYEEGTLIIDILDPVQHTLVWRGIGTKQISAGSDPAKADRDMDAAIFAIMKNFPPVK